MGFQDDVTAYLRAGFPLLYTQSFEERRVIRALIDASNALPSANTRTVWAWTITKGWVEQINSRTREERPVVHEIKDPQKALLKIVDPKQSPLPEKSVCVLLDFHWFIDPTNPSCLEVLRTLRDIMPVLKQTERTVVILSPRLVIAPEIEKDVTPVPFPLPSRAELDSVLKVIVDSVGESKAGIHDRGVLLDALRGLTWVEAENVAAFALVKHGNLGSSAVKTVQREKAAIVKKTGLLEFREPQNAIDGVGGLDNLKTWVAKRKKAFSDKARAYGIRTPKGVLLVGQRGCGKSASAEAIADEYGLPLLRGDIGKFYGSLVGESEQNTDRAIAIAEACAPCVLMFDEIEKGLAGSQSGGKLDSGVGARVFGKMLTWLNDKTSPVFVVATANNIEMIPPEFIRKGR